MSTSPTEAGAWTVESFRLRLPDWAGTLQAEVPLARIEAALMAELSCPVRLLRWAVVQTERDSGAYWCEGAYLKQPAGSADFR